MNGILVRLLSIRNIVMSATLLSSVVCVAVLLSAQTPEPAAPGADTPVDREQKPADHDARPGTADPKPEPHEKRPDARPTKDAKPAKTGTPLPPEVVSQAERVARLHRTIEADEKSLETLQTRLNDPNNDYHRAEKFFRDIDGQLRDKRKEQKKQRDDGHAAEAAAMEAELQVMEKRRKLGAERFDTLIEEKKVLQAKVGALTEKIRQNRQALERLTGDSNPKPPAEGGSTTSAPTPTTSVPATVAPNPEPRVTAVTPGRPALPASPAEPARPSAVTDPSDRVISPELMRARAEAQAKEQEAAAAKEAARSVVSRIEALRRTIDLEQKLIASGRKKLDEMQEVRKLYEEQLQKKVAAHAPQPEIEEILGKLEKIRGRVADLETDGRASTDRLNDLQTEQNALQGEQIITLREADRMDKEAAAARQQVAALQNPFTPHNLIQWFVNHGPRLFFIFLGTLVFRRLVFMTSRQLATAMAAHGDRGSQEERENRAQTLVGVFRNTASLAIGAGGGLMLFDEVGIPIVPLMGGAAVLGLAVAFGAQNLIRDYFSGFMVLLEDQFGIGDVVKIGDTSGTVERITLRVTVLRDLDGVVHFIPNGHITTVSNMTHGWSRALFEIAIGYRENTDQVLAVLHDLALELRHDPGFAKDILDDPEMLGVDSLGESAVVLKFLVKTRPLRQWGVKRELLRRIKQKFDALNIEFPYPHRTLLHRVDPDGETGRRFPGAFAA